MARTELDRLAIASVSAALRDMAGVSQSVRDMTGVSESIRSLVGPTASQSLLRDIAPSMSVSGMVDAARRQADEQLERVIRPNTASISQVFERAGRAGVDAQAMLNLNGVGMDLERLAASTAGSGMLIQQAKLASESVLQQFRTYGFDDAIKRTAQVLKTEFTGSRMLDEALRSSEALQDQARLSMSGVDYAFQATKQAADTRQAFIDAAGASVFHLRAAAIDSVLSNAGSAFERLARQISGLDLTEVSSWSAASTMLEQASWEELSGLASELARELRTEPAKQRKRKTAGHSKNVAVLEVSPVVAPVGPRVSDARIALIIAILVALFGDDMLGRLKDAFFAEPQKQEIHRESLDLALAPFAITLRAAPDADSQILAEAQAGAFVGILEIKDGWALAEIEVGPESKIRGWIKGGSVMLDHEAPAEKARTLESPAPPTPRFPLPLPILIELAGGHAGTRFVEFFTSVLRAPNTRMAYWHACAAFLERCAASGLTLEAITSGHVADYVGHLSKTRAAQTVKQHLAAIRRIFEHLVAGQVLSVNPAASVRTPKKDFVQTATATLDDSQVRLLFSQFDPMLLSDARDRAILATMLYGFTRPSVIAKMRVRDFEGDAETSWFIVEGKDGKPQRIRAHPTAAEFVEAYVVAAGMKAQPDSLLFRSLGRGRKGQLTSQGLRREEIYAMVRRRTAAVGLPANIGCQSLRGAGIANFLKNGGSVDSAALLAGHAHISSTKLYDRQEKATDGADIERMRF